MTDRDHFAAAALTGFASQPRFNCGSVLTLTAKQCYELADAMLRERSRAGQNSSGGTESAAKCTERDSANHDAAPAATAGTPGTGDTQSFDAYRRFVGEVMNWISEATGFLHDDVLRTDDARDLIHNACMRCWDAFDRIAYLTVHGASPEARASVDSVAPQPTTHGDSDRTDKAAPRPSEGTGDTPATHATPAQGSVQRECTEPVAWAVMPSNSDYCVTLSTRKEAAKKAAERKVEVGEYATMDDIVIVPLYRHPPCQDVSQKNLTLTDAEREALERASIAYELLPTEGAQQVSATLRGLLERLGGVE